ncbi:hypothetical protein [Tsukamurella strandjordii]|uniref:Lipoprotein n=1 Tax=Tsukamurella strandjordii TaxID=147577 RepID=A0AA90NDN1_9ACTN|nr:hypothetical protein [Tsukamurella strandjordii]MDP0396435.1 hypothetical protein [Tsukamurella strandjordii]
MQRVMIGVVVAAACYPLSACDTPEAAPRTPPRISTVSDVSTLTDLAADEFVASLNTIGAPTGQRCRRTGPGQDTGRDRGGLLASPQSLTVSTVTYTKDVTIDASAVIDGDGEAGMSVVIPPESRGAKTRFTATYDGIDIANRRGLHPEGYAATSQWALMFTQVVTKRDFPFTCTGPSGDQVSVHTVGVWDGLRLAAYPDSESEPIVIKETGLP